MNGQTHLYKISKRASRPVGALVMSSVNFDQGKICMRFDALFRDPTQVSGLATSRLLLNTSLIQCSSHFTCFASREQQPRTARLLNFIR